MQDLSLVLASKDLFLSLSSHKIKTLKQSYSLNDPRIEKVRSQYEKIKEKVAFDLSSTGIDLKGNIRSSRIQNNPIKFYLERASIIEILGAKGSGKTALLLELALQYHDKNKSVKIKILNCAGGITSTRMAKLNKLDYEYCDIFDVEGLLKTIEISKTEDPGLLVVDSQANLLFGYDRYRVGLGEHFIELRDKGWSVYYTNYVQNRLEIDEKQILNPMGYFAQIFGGVNDCKLVVKPRQEGKSGIQVTMVKSIDDNKSKYNAEMDVSGIFRMRLQKE